MQTLRLLFWLKWKLTLRGLTRKPSALVSAAIIVLVFLPIAVGVAGGFGFGFVKATPSFAGHLLRVMLLGIYTLWLIAPLLGYALNDSYDVSKLLPYPVSPRRIFVGIVCGSLLDLTTLLALPALCAAIYGFGRDPVAFLFAVATMALFLFHTFALSQAVLLLSANFLRSRRFRESLFLIFIGMWILFYLAQQSLLSGLHSFDPRVVFKSAFWDILSYFPHGLAARTLEAVQLQLYGRALGWLAALGLVTAGAVYLAAALLERVYSGDISSPQTGPKPEKAARTRAPAKEETTLRIFGRAVPQVVQAMIEKEFRYQQRDPYFKALLSSLVYMLVVAVCLFVGPMRGQRMDAGGYLVWLMSGMVLLTEMQAICNIFGTEGASAVTLFQFPCSRRQILVGKNIALLVLLSIANFVYITVLSAVANQWTHYALIFVWAELSLLVFVAVGNVVSLYFPLRVVMKGWYIRQQSANKGCSFTLLYMLVMSASLAILSPVLAAFLTPLVLNSPGWLVLSLPFALVYAIGLYFLSLTIAEPMLRERETILIDRLTQPEA